MTDNTRNTDLLDRVAAEIHDPRLDDETVKAATDRVWNAIPAEVSEDTPRRSLSCARNSVVVASSGLSASQASSVVAASSRPAERAAWKARRASVADGEMS